MKSEGVNKQTKLNNEEKYTKNVIIIIIIIIIIINSKHLFQLSIPRRDLEISIKYPKITFTQT
jgi:hypothetical protein